MSISDLNHNSRELMQSRGVVVVCILCVCMSVTCIAVNPDAAGHVLIIPQMKCTQSALVMSGRVDVVEVRLYSSITSERDEDSNHNLFLTISDSKNVELARVHVRRNLTGSEWITFDVSKYDIKYDRPETIRVGVSADSPTGVFWELSNDYYPEGFASFAGNTHQELDFVFRTFALPVQKEHGTRGRTGRVPLIPGAPSTSAP